MPSKKKISRKSLVELSALAGQFFTMEQASRGYKVNDVECQIITRTAFQDWADRLAEMVERDKILFRFFSKIISFEDCWIWGGSFNGRSGRKYGSVRIKGHLYVASRASYILFKGPIPKGMLVMHKCDNPPCVNPKHLIVGTFEDNMKDMLKKKRSAWGEKNKNAKLTAKQVLEIRKRLKKGEESGELAKEFGVKQRTIFEIESRQTWKQLTKPDKE